MKMHDEMPNHRKAEAAFAAQKAAKNLQPQGGGLLGEIIGFILTLAFRLVLGIITILPKYIWNNFIKRS